MYSETDGAWRRRCVWQREGKITGGEEESNKRETAKGGDKLTAKLKISKGFFSFGKSQASGQFCQSMETSYYISFIKNIPLEQQL